MKVEHPKPRRLIGLLLSLSLLACLASGTAQALPITKNLIVNVVTICATDGTNCASMGPAGDLFFAAETNKIWAQAGIQFTFVQQPNLNNSNFLRIDDANPSKSFDALSDPSSTTVTMWLAKTVVGAYGEGWLGAGGVVIAMDTVMSFNSGVGRLDTIAHEIGHNLGLVPTADGHDDSNPNYLIASGGIRNIPTSLAQICPDGPCYDLLSADHITLARQSSLLQDVNVFEPDSLSLLAIGALGGIWARRRVGAVRVN